MTKSQRDKITRDVATEMAILRLLRHPRVVQVYGVVTADPTEIAIVMEYCAGGSLRALLDTRKTAVGAPEFTRWIADIAVGMSYLYSQGVEHRDLKSANCLLDEAQKRVKVADFGLSKSGDTNTHTTTQGGGGAAGTFAFMAPELIGEEEFSEKSDVYSLAIVIWECATRRSPWEGLNQMQLINRVVYKGERPQLTDEEQAAAPAEIVALMRRCWAADAGARPAFAEIMQETGVMCERIRLATPDGDQRSAPASDPATAGAALEAPAASCAVPNPVSTEF